MSGITVQIGGRRIGAGSPCLVIAEAGSGHQGSLSKAFELIEAAARAGADCIKFQVIFADEIVHPNTGSIELPGGRTPIYERFRDLEREPSFYRRLKEQAEKRGLLFLCSAFGPRGARLLRELGVPAVKVASPELNHFPLLRELAGYGLPLILSTGVSTLSDIERALIAAAGCPTVLLHCITAYPAPEEQYNLRLIPNLEAVFGRPVGVSDHSRDPLLVPGLAAALGACVVEKHIALSAADGGLDDPIALEPEAFAAMVAGMRRIEAMGPDAARSWLEEQYGRSRVEQTLGDGIKRLAASERGCYLSTNRSLHALGEIRAGTPIRLEQVCIVRSESNLRPGLGPEYLELIEGRTAQRTIPAGEGITWEDILPPVREELLQLVDRRGRPTGTAPRRQCHGNPELIQAVVHLHLFDPAGRLFLQKRAASKDRFPGRWDTSVGGHMAPGESPEQAIRREALEELAIELDSGQAGPFERLKPYIYGDEIETEYVAAFRLVYSGSPRYNTGEVEEGAFFELEEIRRRLDEEPELFTPHFKAAFEHLVGGR
jgi:sialic acid synthase SpsE/isopentenyldiphosphate isomerase